MKVKETHCRSVVFVCDECIELCNEIIRDELPASVSDNQRTLKSVCPPAEIKANPGQLRRWPGMAKRILAVCGPQPT